MTTGKAKVTGSFEPLESDDLIRANALKIREGRHSIEEAILRLQAETGNYFALHEAVYAGAIKSYAPGDDKDPIVCEAHQRSLREEIYWDDVIKWIAIEFPRFKYPVTHIPAAPVAAAGAHGGSGTVWTAERKEAARAMLNEKRGQGIKAFATETAAAFRVTPTRLREVLNDKPKKAPAKKSKGVWDV